MQFNNAPLVVEQNNDTKKPVNTYIVYDLCNWPKILLRDFRLKNCLFGATIIGKDSDKSKYEYSSYGIAFDGKSEWSFGKDYARNVTIFDADNSSSSHTDNRKNIFLVLDEGDTFHINGSSGTPEKNLILVKYREKVLILVKQRQNFAWVCITMVIIVICLLMEKSTSLKQKIKISTL